MSDYALDALGAGFIIGIVCFSFGLFLLPRRLDRRWYINTKPGAFRLVSIGISYIISSLIYYVVVTIHGPGFMKSLFQQSMVLAVVLGVLYVYARLRLAGITSGFDKNSVTITREEREIKFTYVAVLVLGPLVYVSLIFALLILLQYV